MEINQSVCFPIMEPLPLPLPAFVEAVAKIGYAAVEIWRPGPDLARLYELTQKHGLRIASMSGHDRVEVGLNDLSQHERIINELRESIDLARSYQIPGLICFSGNRRVGVSEEEAIETCAAGLRQIAPYAEENGVTLNLELLNSLVNHPGYQADHTTWGLDVVKRVNSPCVKLLYDIYHMQIMEGNLIQTITQNIAWIGHFHTAGVPGRHEIDDTQEINYRGLCQAIASSGYDRYLGHEYRPTRSLMQTLEEAFAICHQD